MTAILFYLAGSATGAGLVALVAITEVKRARESAEWSLQRYAQLVREIREEINREPTE